MGRRYSSVNSKPALVFVANDRNVNDAALGVYDQLRRAIHSAREVCRWAGDIVVLDCGLNPLQQDALRAAGVTPFLVDARQPKVMRQPYLWKVLADKFALGDPLIVADADLEFRDPDALNSLVEIAGRGKCFIAEEPATWHSSLHPLVELAGSTPDKLVFLMETLYPVLANQPVLNAGLFGGPREWLGRLLDDVRMLTAGLLDVHTWFWEQLALSYWFRHWAYADHVEILPANMNWITAWGFNQAARVYHLHKNIGADQAREVPEEYLQPRLHRLQPDRSAGVMFRGAKAGFI